MMKQMIKKRAKLLILTLFLSLLAIGLVHAQSVSIVAPTVGGTILTGSTQVLNATYTPTAEDENLTNLTWYYSIDDLVTWTILQQHNITPADNLTRANITIDTTGISDSADIDLNVTVQSNDGQSVDAVLSGLRLDNNAPSTSSCVITNTAKLLLVDVSASADTADTAVTMNVTLWRPGGIQVAERNLQINDTASTIQISKTFPPGQYVVTCQALDELEQSTNAANQTVFYRSDDDDEDFVIQTVKPSGETDGMSTGLLVVILGSVVVFVGGGMMMMNRGKKRRR